jgi:predicted DNA-binding transcriptional regulator YafY
LGQASKKGGDAVGARRTANERHAEIMRILESRRHKKMSNFAFQFYVSIRTIFNDIEILTASYPIETLRGPKGCVKLMDGYATYQSILSDEQQKTLMDIFPLLNETQSKVIYGLLCAHGSKRNIERISGLTP